MHMCPNCYNMCDCHGDTGEEDNTCFKVAVVCECECTKDEKI